MSDKSKTPAVCSGNCKCADMKDCIDIHLALNELKDGISMSFESADCDCDCACNLSEIVMNEITAWFYDNVEKIKLVTDK